MRMFVAIAATLAAATLGGSMITAQADPYRWCAQYSGKGARNCYFVTLEQCRAAVSGNGGFCEPNTFYDGRPVMAEERNRRARVQTR